MTGGGAGNRPRRFGIGRAPGLVPGLETTHLRSVVRNRRPMLEVRFRGTVGTPDRGGGPASMPIIGEGRPDIVSGAIMELDFRR